MCLSNLHKILKVNPDLCRIYHTREGYLLISCLCATEEGLIIGAETFPIETRETIGQITGHHISRKVSEEEDIEKEITK